VIVDGLKPPGLFGLEPATHIHLLFRFWAPFGFSLLGFNSNLWSLLVASVRAFIGFKLFHPTTVCVPIWLSYV
jgi:hypothetical protein